MSEYFSNFPKILYDIEGTNQRNPSFTTAANLMIRQRFRDAIVDEITAFYPYFIQESERPDTLAFDVYGDIKYIWVILMINNIIDPYWQWPLDAKNFTKYICQNDGKSLANLFLKDGCYHDYIYGNFRGRKNISIMLSDYFHRDG